MVIFDNPTCGLFKRNIEDACKTLRKLPYFGYAAGQAPKFEWPTKDDLLRMPLGRPIRVTGFRYKKESKTIRGI